MLRISDAAGLGLHAGALLAAREERTVPVGELARRLGASEAHLAKVLQRLRQAGLVQGRRGPSGGYRLAGPAAEISLLAVVEAVSGPFGASSCLLGRSHCLGDTCLMGSLLHEVDSRVTAYLAATTLADVAPAAVGEES